MQKWIIFTLMASILLFVGGGIATEDPSERSVTVMSYNIHHGANWRGEYDLDGTKNAIGLTGADIVAVQEVDQSWGMRSQYMRQLDWLAENLEMYAAFGGALKSKTGEYGVGILSKYPIISSETFTLPGKLERRVLLVTEIDVKGKRLYVFTTHLGLAIEDRVLQIQEIARIAQKYQGEQMILMGDFNVASDAPEVAPLFEQYYEEKTNLSTGLHETLIGGKKKIDYIFTSPMIIVQKLATLVWATSDHYPLVARLNLQ